VWPKPETVWSETGSLYLLLSITGVVLYVLRHFVKRVPESRGNMCPHYSTHCVYTPGEFSSMSAQQYWTSLGKCIAHEKLHKAILMAVCYFCVCFLTRSANLPEGLYIFLITYWSTLAVSTSLRGSNAAFTSNKLHELSWFRKCRAFSVQLVRHERRSTRNRTGSVSIQIGLPGNGYYSQFTPPDPARHDSTRPPSSRVVGRCELVITDIKETRLWHLHNHHYHHRHHHHHQLQQQ